MDNEKLDQLKKNLFSSERYEELYNLCMCNMNEYDPHTQTELAKSCLLIPRMSEAAERLTAAARMGDAEALYRLGLCYKYGNGVSPDPEAALDCFMRAANRRHIPAMLEAARHYERSLTLAAIDYEAARDYYERAADAGSVEAIIRLAQYYAMGKGVQRDPKKAFELCEQAVNCGSVRAMCMLGKFYKYGYGTMKDEASATLYYEYAAKEKNPEAQYAYYAQKGDETLLTKTSQMYMQAQTAAYDELCEYFGKDKTENCFDYAIHGDIDALFICGLFAHAVKNYCPYSTEIAFDYFREAALNDHAGALWYAGDYYMAGRYVTQNYDEAYRLFKLSAEQNHAPALWSLGFCLETGRGCTQNTSQALNFYIKAAELGYAPALATLAILYETGTFTEENYEKAQKLYTAIPQERRLLSPWTELKPYYPYIFPKEESVLQYRTCRFEEIRTNDSSKLFGSYNKLAEEGCVFALQRLGNMLEFGTSKSSRRPEKAFDCYTTAVELGYEPAKAELERFSGLYPAIVAKYYESKNTHEDTEKAFEMYLSAAKSGDASAMKKTARSYKDGIGTEKDMANAYKWSCRAMLHKCEWVQSLWHYMTYLNEVPEDKLYDTLISDSSLRASYFLGVCYETGFCVDTDEKKAFACYKTAAENDYRWAHFALGRCYEMGIGTKKDEEAAARCYLRALFEKDSIAIRYFSDNLAKFKSAAISKSPIVQCLFAQCLENGYGISEDKAAAYALYGAAAGSGSDWGLFLLGRCCEKGYGTEADAKRAFSLYAEAAKKSCAYAMSAIGEFFRNGNLTETNLEKAIAWHKAGAALSCSLASYRLGLCLMPYDRKGGIQALLTAANTENPLAQYALAKEYLNDNEEEKALKWLERAATNGSHEACCLLGQRLILKPSEAEKKKGFEMLTLSSSAGNSDAKKAVAECYARGIGVNKNAAEGFKWYNAAMQAGNADAAYSLGSCYERGFGTHINLVEAVRAYTFAAERGHSDAQYALGACYAKGKGTQKNMSMAVYWYELSVSQGNDKAQTALGICYEMGQGGLPVDIKTAMELYTLGAEKGNYIAQYRLGMCYEKGRYVETNPELAVYWYTRSAESGNSVAQYTLGECYENGFGVEKCMKKAVELYRKAAEGKVAEAAYRLGTCYEYGYGVEQDLRLAMSWYRKAGVQGYRTSGKPYNHKNKQK